MYKHMADSVKETNERSFISSTERETFNSKADPSHNHNDRYYTKSYIDTRLDNALVEFSGENINIPTSIGFVNDLEIKGCSKFIDMYTKCSNVGDPLSENRFKINLSSQSLNLFNFKKFASLIININGVFINYTDKSITFDSSVYNPVLNSVKDIFEKSIEVSPNKQYVIQYDFEDVGDLNACIGFRYADETTQFKGRDGKLTGTIRDLSIADKSINLIGLAWNTQKNGGKTIIKNIMVHEVVPETIEYHDYEKYNTEIILPCQLEQIQETKDTIFKDTDGLWKIKKFIKKVYINSSEFENRDGHSYKVPHRLIGAKAKRSWNSLSGTRMFVHWKHGNRHIEEKAVFDDIANQNTLHYFFIENDGLSISITNGLYNAFKDQENALFEVDYILEEPEIIVLPEQVQINLNTFKDRTIITSEQNNGIKPLITGKVVTSIVKSLSSSYQMVENNKKRIDLLTNLKDNQELDYCMSNNLLEIEDSTRGIISDIKISGKTIQNIIYKQPILNQMSFAGHTPNFTYSISKGYLKWSNPTNSGYPKLLLPYNLLEENRDYTLFFSFDASNISSISSVQMAYGCSEDMYPGHSQAKTVDLKSKSGIAAVHIRITPELLQYGELSKFKIGFSYFNGTGSFIMSMPVLVEGKLTVKDFPGIIDAFGSVDSIHHGLDIPMSIKTCSRNLFDAKSYSETILRSDPDAGIVSYNGTGIRIYSKEVDGWMTTGMDTEQTRQEKYRKFAIKVKPNTKYTISYIVKSLYGDVSTDLYIGYKTNDLSHTKFIFKNASNTITNNVLKNEFITPIDCEYVVIRFDNNKAKTTVEFNDIMLNEGEYIPYEPFRSSSKDIKTINGDNVKDLRSLPNGVKDTIEKIDGKYYLIKRCGIYTFNGTEEGWTTAYSSFGTDTICFGVYLPLSTFKRKASRFNQIFDSFKTMDNYDVQTSLDIESAAMNTAEEYSNVAYIRIKRSRLTSVDVSGFTNWLKENPVRMIYELLEPEIYELQNIEPESFEGYTYMYFPSTIKAEVEFKVPTHINNTIFSLQDKIKILEERVNTLSITQLSKALKVIDQSDKVDSLLGK